jgi:hypothetical protein
MLEPFGIPANRTPITQDQAGTVARDWYRFFFNLYSRQLSRGAFHSEVTQTALAINTAYALTFDKTDFSKNVYIGTPTSRVYVTYRGSYNIQFSLQATTISSSSEYLYIWLRIDGVDVPWSSSRVEFKGAGNDKILAWNFLVEMEAGSYFELMWSVDSTNITIPAIAAIAPSPDIPSVILTVIEDSI